MTVESDVWNQIVEVKSKTHCILAVCVWTSYRISFSLFLKLPQWMLKGLNKLMFVKWLTQLLANKIYYLLLPLFFLLSYWTSQRAMSIWTSSFPLEKNSSVSHHFAQLNSIQLLISVQVLPDPGSCPKSRRFSFFSLPKQFLNIKSKFLLSPTENCVYWVICQSFPMDY